MSIGMFDNINQLRLRLASLSTLNSTDLAYGLMVSEVNQTFSIVERVVAEDLTPAFMTHLLNYIVAIAIKVRYALTLDDEPRKERIIMIKSDLDQHYQIYAAAAPQNSLALMAANIITLAEMVYVMKLRINELEDAADAALDETEPMVEVGLGANNKPEESIEPIESWPALPIASATPPSDIKEKSIEIWTKLSVKLGQ